MILRSACFVLLFFLCSFIGAGYFLVKSNLVKAQFMTTDKLGNCYTVLENNEVDKYNSTGVQEFNFSNKNLGKLKWVDATNPLKLLLFYPDFNQVVMLDNKLSLRSQFSLRDLDILQPLLICTSVNEGIWVYDQEDFQLKRLDTDLKVIQESGNIVQVTGVTLQPVQLVEANGYLYLNNPKTGVLVFDLFGTYYKTIPIKNITAFQILGDELFYFKEKKGNTFHLKTLADNPYEMPDIADTTVQFIRIENQKLFLLKPGALNIYSRI
jgi:hypothetical protein